jgi:hypothetical protein
MQCESIRDRFTNTMYENYGCGHALQCESIRDKFTNTMHERYGDIHPSQINISEDILGKLNSKEWLEDQYKNKNTYEMASDLGVGHSTVIRYMEKFDIKRDNHYFISKGEKELFSFINVICTTRC